MKMLKGILKMIPIILIIAGCSLFSSCASNKIVAKNCEEIETQEDYYLCDEVK